jgi:diaminopimelate decarboxylase
MTSSAVDWSLLPLTADVGADQTARVGGVSLLDLAGEFGTPLFVYDEEHLRARCAEAVAAFPDGVAFASKAFLCGAMVRIALAAGMSVDVATGGELAAALAAGAAGDRLVMHGNNKSIAELRDATAAGVGRIVVDSFDEFDRLEWLASTTAAWKAPEILVRLTPGVEAHTHEFVRTGHDDSKFGFSTGLGLATRALERARRLHDMGVVRLVGVHAHVGSQVFDIDSFRQAAEVLAQIFVPLGLDELCVGGGLGVAYVNGEHAPSLAEWGSALRGALLAAGVDPATRVTAEPGRSICAAAAVTLYEVGTIKEVPGVRTFLSVDGGMSDNPRPVLYGSGYEAFLARSPRAQRTRTVTIMGKHCESGDMLIRDAAVPADVVVGDILVTPVTGAYGYSMASNYNRVPRPAVVFVDSGSARLVMRRETAEDLNNLDVSLP